MRVLFTLQPSFSQLNSVLTLTRALARAGHVTSVAVARCFVPAARAVGLQAFSAGPEWSERSELVGTTLEGHQTLLPSFAELARRGMVEDLITLVEHWKPDVIVRDETEFGGWIAAELLELPLFTCSHTGGLPRWVLLQLAGRPIAELLQDYGLPPDPDLRRLYANPYLRPTPVSIDMPGHEPERDLRYRPEPFDEPTAETEEAVLASGIHVDEELPLVHLTLGTVYAYSRLARMVYETVMTALADEPLRLIVAVGPEGDPSSFGTPSRNTRVERFVSHRALIPKCDLLISHGGYGSTLLAVANGVPSCLMPLAADQPFTARRLVEAGVGLFAGTSPDAQFPVVRADLLNADDVLHTVQRLLHDPSFKAATARLREEFRNLPDPQAIVEALTSLVSSSGL